MNPVIHEQFPVALTLRESDEATLSIVAERILVLITTHHRDITVAINGSSTDVGKTYISCGIGRLLRQQKIATVHLHCVRAIASAMEQMQPQKSICNASRGVFMFGAEMLDGGAKNSLLVATLRESFDKQLRECSGEAIQAIDLWIAIYRPDLPFTNPCVLADILIRNEGAKDKSKT